MTYTNIRLCGFWRRSYVKADVPDGSAWLRSLTEMEANLLQALREGILA